MGNPNINSNRTQAEPTVLPEGIPLLFRERNNWVNWKIREVDGKRKKEPVDKAGYRIDITKPQNFLSYRQAYETLRQFPSLDGIGFALTPRDGLCCIDIDNALTEGGQLKTQAWLVLKTIGPTYVEYSPSLKGLHVWTKATIEQGRRFKNLPEGVDVEVYGRDRYMTMTGKGYGCAGYPLHPQVEAKQDEVEALVAELEQRGRLGGSDKQTEQGQASDRKKTTATGGQGQEQPGATGGKGGDWRSVELDLNPMTDEDAELVGRICKGKQREKFLKLWEHGDISDYQNDHSAADMALVCIIAWYTTDTKQICRIFISSKLAGRKKTQTRNDYIQRTIKNALDFVAKRKAEADFAGYQSDYRPGGEQDMGREQDDGTGTGTGTGGPNLNDTARKAWEEQQRRQEQQARQDAAKQKADAILANMQPASDRTEEPPPIKYIIKPQLSDDTGVSFLVGPGGGGKSFQALIRCIAIASGRPIGRAHQTEVTAPAIFISLEDPAKVLQRRYFYTIAAIEEHYGPFTTGQLAALDANLRRLPVRGQMGALMELDGRGNPRPTTDYDALREIIERVQPAYIVLDTMSRALGVDENNNAHAAQWIGALEQILFDHPDTVFQIVGHTGKPNGKDNQDEKAGDPLSLRGASAFAWNARAVENYTKASEPETQALGIEGKEAKEVFKLTLPKHNYTAGFDGPIYFWRDAHGVPIEFDIDGMKAARDAANLEAAVRAVPYIAKAAQDKDKRRLNRRQWQLGIDPDNTDPKKKGQGRHEKAMAALLAKGIARDQVPSAIKEAIAREYVRAVKGERQGDKPGKPPVEIEFAHYPADTDDDE